MNDLIENDEVEFEGEDLEEEIGIPEDFEKRTILTQSSDPEIESLYRKWKKGKLILQADFQRQFVWDKKKASRLIESALLSVPIPMIYLAENSNGTEFVIDGQQRLTSFFSYIDGKFPNGDPFKLSKLDVFPELKNKFFQDIDEITQDKIQYYQVRTITILKNSDPELKFEIFERLNTGSVPLNDMELRNCVYRGPYMQLLKEMSEIQDFKDLVGFKKPDKRMRDIELVLRFAAFYHKTYLKYQPPMRKFFNNDMEQYQNISEQEKIELIRAFKNSISIIKSIFGNNAFKRFYKGDEDNPNGKWELKKFNTSLYDVLMGTFAEMDKNKVYQHLDQIKEGLLHLISSNQEFIDAILISTSSLEKVRKRFDLARKVVEDIMKYEIKEPRCFSFELKKELYEKNPICQICGNHISIIEDAAVDHINQYWMGGRTIPENARLAHRYCNSSRSKYD